MIKTASFVVKDELPFLPGSFIMNVPPTYNGKNPERKVMSSMNTIGYVVQHGDTPKRIAARFGISPASWAAFNPQWNGEPLIPGELVQVPVRLPRRYVVQQGDTWESIAEKSQASLRRLREVNAESPGQPEAGQIVELPAADTERIVRLTAEYGSRQLDKDLDALKRRYPFVAASVIGKSVMGKPIHSLRIGEGAFRLHVNGAMHANEWITALALMRFAEEYARACKRKGTIGGKPAARLYDRCTLWIVPMVNPDGVDLVLDGIAPDHPRYAELLRWNNGSDRFHRWKANIRGVDLNDQFPAHWEEERFRRGADGPGPRDYGGSAPLTEPEAKALADFARETDFHAAIAFHTQGEEIYWNYRGMEPRHSLAWAQRLGKASGYRPVRLEGSDAGFKDWFISEFKRPGFTVEAGWGRNPLPLESLAEWYTEILALLAEAMELSD
ncbi:M14 family metallopeptidase [Cohnella algarum]|uniref:M14 family metallopeptidase n=1 Tax=Cohnella algarum TaxID=2044859 RepID=UPI0030844D31